MTTAATSKDYAAFVRALDEQTAMQMGAVATLRSDGEKAAWHERTKTIAHARRVLANLPSDLERVEAQLSALEASRAPTAAKQADIEEQIATAPDPQAIKDGRERDREIERVRQLRLSLELLAAGQLHRAPGQTYPPLSYLDARIAELTEKATTLRGNLATAVEQAEQLLAPVMT